MFGWVNMKMFLFYVRISYHIHLVQVGVEYFLLDIKIQSSLPAQYKARLSFSIIYITVTLNSILCISNFTMRLKFQLNLLGNVK